MSSAATSVPSGLIAAPPEDLCLAFVNTRYWRGQEPPTDDLRSLDDVTAWAAATGGMDPVVVAAVRAAWRSQPEAEAAAFSAGIAVREALFRVFSAVASGAPAAAGDLGELNAALRAAAPRSRMACRDGRFVWAVNELPPTMTALLSPVLWSAADLLAGGRRERVRQCDNPKCRWVFLDDSKSGNRRWCSMASCGNRAKAHRHYLKRKEAAG